MAVLSLKKFERYVLTGDILTEANDVGSNDEDEDIEDVSDTFLIKLARAIIKSAKYKIYLSIFHMIYTSFSTKLTIVLVGLPDIPLERYFTSPPPLSMTPAMSRWSQEGQEVKFDKKPAAVQDPPPGVSDILLRSASGDFFILSLYDLQRGILQTLSPAEAPDCDNSDQSWEVRE